MLRRFARQAGREILFAIDQVAGARTRAVSGKLSVQAALDRMLGGTGLVASIDAKTGAVAVRRGSAAASANASAANDPAGAPGMTVSAANDPYALVPPRTVLAAPRASVARHPVSRAAGLDESRVAGRESGRDRPVVLSEFRVDTAKDRGYRATNSISGTRLNLGLKDLPMPVEVITEDFIRDIGALDAREALAFSAGVLLTSGFDNGAGQSGSFDFSPSGSGGNFNPESDYKLRGFTTSVTLRNGFIVRPPNDSANIARIEVVRGPAALLYGHSILAGVINIIPKYPLSEPAFGASIAAGSFGLLRATADAGGALLRRGGQTLDYRLNLAFQERGDWTEHLHTRLRFVAPAFAWSPRPGTSVFVDLELRDLRRTGGQIQDLEAPNAGVDEFGRRLTYARDLFGRGAEFRWSGRDNFTDDRSYTGLVQLEQKAGEHVTLLASHHRHDNRRRQRNLRNVSVQTGLDAIPAEFRAPLPLGGAGFEAIRYEWNTQPEDTLIDSTRLEAHLRFAATLPRLGASSHSLLLGLQDTKQTIDFGLMNRLPGQDFSWKRTDDPAYFRYRGEQYTRTRDRIDERWQAGHYAVYHGRFWEERLQLVGGVRLGRYLVRTTEHDYVDGARRADPRGSRASDPAADQRAWNTGATAAAAGATGARSSDPPIRAGYRFGGEPQREESPMAGASLRLNREISAYALTSTGLVPNPGQRDGLGRNFRAESTRSREVGLKFDLWRGRISGTISRFEVERDNAIWFYSFAPSPRNNRTQPGGSGFDPRLPRSFGVYRTTVQAVAALHGRPGFVPERPATALGAAPEANAPDALDWVLNYETMRARDSQPGRFGLTPAAEVEARIMRDSIEAMLTGRLPNGQPNPTPGPEFRAENDFLNGGGANWTGNSRGSDTGFGDRAEGWDAQVIVSPTERWQLVLGYANIRRTVSRGFQFVDFEDLSDGVNYGTEYDLWVNRFGGPAKFQDPLRASTGDADTLVGLSLDDSPRHTFTCWNHLRFDAGFSVGLGFIWTGRRPSTIPIGGGNLSENRFANPPVAARAEWRMGLGYRLRIGGRDCNLRLHVNNLLDDRKDETIARYADDAGVPVLRQTVRYYRPRDVRFSASVDF